MTKCRINLKDAVDELAPPSPPCFHDRKSWMQYLHSAALAQGERDEPTVIKVSKDGAITFCFDFPMCADCTRTKSTEMKRTGRCNPLYLSQLRDSYS